MSDLLSQLKQHSVVVADTGDFAAMRKYQPRDATTNPSLLLKAGTLPEYAGLVDRAVADAKAEVVQVQGSNPFAGAVVVELSPALGEELGIDAYNGGMWVYSVPPRTIARNVGFQPGDIVREINGKTIRTKADFDSALKIAEANPPATWRLATERNGQRIESELRGR
jgi:membrane-associated protease RseP (regulator of RpoE activity)